MNFIYNNRTRNSRWLPIGIFVLTLLFVAELQIYGQTNIVAAASESVVVYPIAVAVNKSVVLRLPKRATRVAVTQPEIAEAVVVTPDQILINGKAVGSTSLVVWFEGKTHQR
jgi:Flp pilus assembly secretin CpaC